MTTPTARRVIAELKNALLLAEQERDRLIELDRRRQLDYDLLSRELVKAAAEITRLQDKYEGGH